MNRPMDFISVHSCHFEHALTVFWLIQALVANWSCYQRQKSRWNKW